MAAISPEDAAFLEAFLAWRRISLDGIPHRYEDKYRSNSPTDIAWNRMAVASEDLFRSKHTKKEWAVCYNEDTGVYQLHHTNTCMSGSLRGRVYDLTYDEALAIRDAFNSTLRKPI